MLQGRNLSAQETKDIGIVNIVIEESAFEENVSACVHQIASGPTRAFGLFKQLMACDLSIAAQLEAEKDAFMEATYAQVFKNAVSNFQHKNKHPFQVAK